MPSGRTFASWSTPSRPGRWPGRDAAGRILQDAGIAWLEDPGSPARTWPGSPIFAAGSKSDRRRGASLSSRRVSHLAAGARRRLRHPRPGPGRRRHALAEDRRARAGAPGTRVRPRGPGDQVHLLSAVANGHMVEYVPRSAGILRAMPRIENGELVAPQGPGLGLELDEAAVRRPGRVAVQYGCAFCGEDNDVFVDPSSRSHQTFTEDCTVCCRPNLITLTIDDDGDAAIEVGRSTKPRGGARVSSRRCVRSTRRPSPGCGWSPRAGEPPRRGRSGDARAATAAAPRRARPRRPGAAAGRPAPAP